MCFIKRSILSKCYGVAVLCAMVGVLGILYVISVCLEKCIFCSGSYVSVVGK